MSCLHVDLNVPKDVQELSTENHNSLSCPVICMYLCTKVIYFILNNLNIIPIYSNIRVYQNNISFANKLLFVMYIVF